MEIALSTRIRCITKHSVFFYAFLLNACTHSSHYAPVVDGLRAARLPNNLHTVVKGDTLYSIAWRYDDNFHTIASINHLTPPYSLMPGQQLRLAVSKPSHTLSHSHIPTKKQANSPVGTQKKRLNTVGRFVDHWFWPTKGRILSSFGSNNKGIDIAGKLGTPIYAAAAGQVAYSGNGLRGYGNLLIIKHNDDFLSAYAHNKQLLVKEGMMVKANQKIALLGNTDAISPKLHFEIRRRGKPVNPLGYLR